MKLNGSRDAGLRIGSGDARGAPQLFDGRAGSGRFDAIADGLLEGGHLDDDRPVAPGRIDARRYSRARPRLVAVLGTPSLSVGPRRGHHRALQRDRIVRVLRIPAARR
jgi:hypothetical protein